LSDHYGLDFKDGAKLFRAEVFGDWYRDPWAWPEIAWAGDHPDRIPIDELIEKTREGITPRIAPEFRPLNIPKSLLGHRPAVVMSTDARLLYLAAIGPSMARLQSDLPEWVYGWRFRPPQGLARNQQEWQSYVTATNSVRQDEWVLQADISSFFSSIPADRLVQEIFERLGNTALATVTSSIINAHDSLSAHSGLPQRSWGSAILANMYLRPIDDTISQRIRRSSISGASRWMDDILVFGAAGDLYSLNLDLLDRVRQAGLELNASKSHLRPSEAFLQEFQMTVIQEVPQTIEPRMTSGAGPPRTHVDMEWLLAREEEVLADPGKYDRSVVRFVLRSLRDNSAFDSHEKWRGLVPQLPHLVDYIGRYLRDAAHYPFCTLQWGALQDWFSEFVVTPWATLPWVRAQLGLIFDSAHTESSNMKEVYREWLESSDDLQLIAVAAQRLGVVDPGMVRDIIRGRLDHVASPLILRVLGLGLLAVDEERALVESVLRRDPRNTLLCKMFDDRGYRAPPVPGDFDWPT
jgi:hypothetical protein